MVKELFSYTPFNTYQSAIPHRNDIEYRRYRRPLMEYIERYHWIIELLKLGTLSFPLLEVGVGSGWGLKQIQDEFPNDTVVGTDLNQNQLLESRSHDVKQLVQHDLTTKLPFPLESFASVICLIVLEQIDKTHIDFILSEINNVMKNDGKLLLATFDRELFSPHKRHWFKHNLHEFTPNEVLEEIDNSGFVVSQRLGQRYIQPHFYSAYSYITQKIEDHHIKKDPIYSYPYSSRWCNIVPPYFSPTEVEAITAHPFTIPVIDMFVCEKK